MASWALRFSLDMEDVIAVLSGMSTLDQVENNIATTKAAQPLSAKETEALWHAMALCSRQRIVLPNGADETELVNKAVDWLKEHSL